MITNANIKKIIVRPKHVKHFSSVAIVKSLLLCKYARIKRRKQIMCRYIIKPWIKSYKTFNPCASKTMRKLKFDGGKKPVFFGECKIVERNGWTAGRGNPKSRDTFKSRFNFNFVPEKYEFIISLETPDTH